jgi:hypothetical protein
MPKRTHRRRHSNTSQEGFVSNELKHTMNKNEKIIMGILLGGIIILLVLSIFVLFKKDTRIVPVTPTAVVTPTVAVAITPYPTIPPIADYTMQVNERRFYPDTVNIKAGHSVIIINIGQTDTDIEPTDKKNVSLAFGLIKPGEQKSIKFNRAGVYIYTRSEKPDQRLTITVR